MKNVLAVGSLWMCMAGAVVAQAAIAVGELVPCRKLLLQSEVAGRVAEVVASPGTRVEAGQLLVVLSSPASEARLREAKAALAVAEADAEQGRLALEIATRQLAVAERDGKSAADGLPRVKEMLETAEQAEAQRQQLYEAGRASTADLQQSRVETLRHREAWEVLGARVKNAQEAVAIARLGVSRAEAALHGTHATVALHRARVSGAEHACDALRVTAPFAGHLHRVHAVPGALVGARDEVLVELLDLSQLRVVFAVEPVAASRLRKTRDLEVRCGERRGRAAIEVVDLVLQAQTGTIAASALLDNTDGVWLAGTRVEVVLPDN